MKAKEELGFASLDKYRPARTGAPEAVFCPGKTSSQIADILLVLMDLHPGENILATRATPENYQVVSAMIPAAVFDPVSRIIHIQRKGEIEESAPVLAVVTAGTADIPIAEEAAVTAELLGHRVDRIYDVGVAGIHRLFDKLERIRSAKVVIVVAGMEAALASVVGGLVQVPVIAVPTHVGYGSSFEGLAALLGMLNSCANGVGVVNIDNGYGAACLASKILKLQQPEIPEAD
jgi:NCAIR mutase (PurE)-related protein